MIIIETPRELFGRFVYGATIDGQTFWVDSQTELDKLIKELSQ